jgi:sulfite reductase alpha subunit-like flavoprotein
MTKQFDALLEQMLNEMMPADIGEIGGFSGAAKHISTNVPEGEPKGHWAPLQKLSSEDRNKVLEEIFKKVFSEKENSYAPTVDNPEDLHDAIQTAIQTVSGSTSLKASGKWAAKFLTDRLMTLLKNKVKYTTSGGEETLQKEMTQKEFKQALNKALEEAPEKSAETASEEPSEEPAKEVETVYTKAADLNSDDADLQKAFSKLPDDKEMSWKEVLKLIGMTKGMALLDNGGLIETEVEKQESEDEEVKDLEFDDENDDETRGYESDFDRAMKNLGGVYTTKDYNPSWD